MNNETQTVAAEFAAAFELATRVDGSRYWQRKDNCAAWITCELMQELHGAVDDRLPCDWLYGLIAAAGDAVAEHLETGGEPEDMASEFGYSQMDIGSSDLYAWAAESGYNRALIEECAEEFGPAENHEAAISQAQVYAASRIYWAVWQAIEDETEGRNT